jgi:hypothetical protein
MNARVSPIGQLLIIAVTGLLVACDGAPTTTPANSESFAAVLLSGQVDLSSASPAESCEAAYVVTHSGLFAQRATAELQTDGTTSRMVLETSDGQQCVFSGIRNDGTLALSARHETCKGYPLSLEAITGIHKTCGTIDVFGEGPYWGQGTLSARRTNSNMDGTWTFDVFDPGFAGPPGISTAATRFNVGLRVHLEP